MTEETPQAAPGAEPAADQADTAAVAATDAHPAAPPAAPPEPTTPASEAPASETPDPATPAPEPEPMPGAGEAPTVAAPVVAAAASATPSGAPVVASAPQNGFFIPRWVGFVALAIVGILVVGGIGYAIGRDNASGGGSNAGANFPGNGNFPGGNTNGNGNLPGGNTNGNGNGGRTLPGGGTLPGNGGTSQSGGFLGVAIQNVTSGSGAEVTAVQDGSPAADAGLDVGDVITKVDSTDIADAAALQQAIRAQAGGDTVTITYTRDGTTSTAKVTLGSAAARIQPS